MARRVFVDPQLERVFRTEGWIVLDLLTPQDVTELLACYEGVRHVHEDGFTPTVLIEDLEVRARIDAAVRKVLAPRVLPVLDDYVMAVGSYAVKAAGSDYSNVGLHQDITFIDEREDDQVCLSIWCPLVPVDRENGCLGVVRGSHTLNSNFREPSSLPYRDLVDLIEAEFMHYLPMQPGEVLFMDSRLFHGSEANRTNQARVVAAGVGVPRESRLIYCHRDFEGDDSQLEIWEVPADFYVRHIVGTRPQEGTLRAVVPRQVAPLTEEGLREHMAAFTAAGAPAYGRMAR